MFREVAEGPSDRAGGAAPNSAGVWLAKVDFDGAGIGIDPQLDDNRISGNTIDGFTYPCIDQGTNTSTSLTCSH